MLVKDKTQYSYRLHKSLINFSTGELLSPIETQNYFIVQIADNYYSNSGSIKNHLQFCDVEITYLNKNSLSCASNDVSFSLEKNDCFLSFKDEKHELLYKNNTRFQTIAFNVKETSPCYPILLKLREMKRNLYKNTYVESLIFEIINAIYLEDSFYLQRCDACITQLLFEFLQNNSNENNIKNLIKSKDLLPDVALYIDENFLKITSLEQISEVFNYSYNYLCRIFKQQFGSSMQDYLLSKKMNFAKELLEKGKSTTDVSYILNYSSPYNFSRAYKNFYGFSPTLKTKLKKNKNNA
jgi:AraC-like DNA-binding protein